jgi:hypothetical protein
MRPPRCILVLLPNCSIIVLSTYILFHHRRSSNRLPGFDSHVPRICPICQIPVPQVIANDLDTALDLLGLLLSFREQFTPFRIVGEERDSMEVKDELFGERRDLTGRDDQAFSSLVLSVQRCDRKSKVYTRVSVLLSHVPTRLYICWRAAHRLVQGCSKPFKRLDDSLTALHFWKKRIGLEGYKWLRRLTLSSER